MFTGLIEEVGKVEHLRGHAEGAHIQVRAEKVLEGTEVGDSIAVNGACLTVVERSAGSFVADCMQETLAHTTLGSLSAGHAVNLERALAMGDSLGGHMVLGHVDATSTVLEVKESRMTKGISLTLPEELQGLVVDKGSIAVDGISLTVTHAQGKIFGIGVIPHTVRQTTLSGVTPGASVNLEADVIARYVRSAMGRAFEGGSASSIRNTGSVDEEFLRRHGFFE